MAEFEHGSRLAQVTRDNDTLKGWCTVDWRVPTVITLMLATTPVSAQQPRNDNKGRERFTAVAVSTGGPRSSGGLTPVEITIDRWSTEAEAERMAKALKEKGADAMLQTLRDLKPVGSIRVPAELGYDLHYAHQMPLAEGGRRIFLATDRPISYWEAVNQPRVTDYPFTFIELHLGPNGEGEGKLALATQINASGNGRFVELVSYRTQPIQLNEVKAQK